MKLICTKCGKNITDDKVIYVNPEPYCERCGDRDFWRKSIFGRIRNFKEKLVLKTVGMPPWIYPHYFPFTHREKWIKLGGGGRK